MSQKTIIPPKISKNNPPKFNQIKQLMKNLKESLFKKKRKK